MRLNQVTLPVVDVAQCVAFYRALGFRQIVDAPHYARNVICLYHAGRNRLDPPWRLQAP